MEIVVVLLACFVLGIPVIAIVALVRSGTIRRLLEETNTELRGELSDLRSEVANLRRDFSRQAALCVARWTLNNAHLRTRTAIQIATSGLLFLYLVPEIVFALKPGAGWSPLLQEAGWRRQIGVQILLLIAVPGVSAAMEFAERGHGTPIPYDPPQRLVTSGMYRYCANPMQMSCALVMFLWAGMLQNVWLILAAVTSAVYSAGIAQWDEGEDLAHRFGNAWRDYRAAVHNWRVRWRPYHNGPSARIYIASSCGPCSELRLWLEARRPVGLHFIDAEELPSGSIRRLRYDPGDGSSTVEGVRAMGRVLEHLNFGWAVAGASLRLPGIWQGVQLLMDASGLGPRTLIPPVRGGCEPVPRVDRPTLRWVAKPN